MGKAAENEKLKLRAAFFNNLAGGLVLTGVVVPYLNTFNITTGQRLAKMADFPLDLIKDPAFIAAVVVFALSMIAAVALRVFANQDIDRIKD